MGSRFRLADASDGARADTIAGLTAEYADEDAWEPKRAARFAELLDELRENGALMLACRADAISERLLSHAYLARYLRTSILRISR